MLIKMNISYKIVAVDQGREQIIVAYKTFLAAVEKYKQGDHVSLPAAIARLEMTAKTAVDPMGFTFNDTLQALNGCDKSLQDTLMVIIYEEIGFYFQVTTKRKKKEGEKAFLGQMSQIKQFLRSDRRGKFDVLPCVEMGENQQGCRANTEIRFGEVIATFDGKWIKNIAEDNYGICYGKLKARFVPRDKPTGVYFANWGFPNSQAVIFRGKIFLIAIAKIPKGDWIHFCYQTANVKFSDTADLRLLDQDKKAIRACFLRKNKVNFLQKTRRPNGDVCVNFSNPSKLEVLKAICFSPHIQKFIRDEGLADDIFLKGLIDIYQKVIQ